MRPTPGTTLDNWTRIPVWFQHNWIEIRPVTPMAPGDNMIPTLPIDPWPSGGGEIVPDDDPGSEFPESPTISPV